MVTTPEVDEWLAAAGRTGQYLTHKDGMVSTIRLPDDPAFDRRQHIFQKRRTCDTRVIGDPLELVLLSAGEMTREMLAILGQDIDGKGARLLQHSVRDDMFVDADQDQRWVQRQRGKRTHRDPIQNLIMGHSHDGDAGSKVTQHAPKFILIDRQGGAFPSRAPKSSAPAQCEGNCNA